MKPSEGLLGSVQYSKLSHPCQRVRLGRGGGDATYRGCGTAGPIPGTCPSVAGSTPTQPAGPPNPYTCAKKHQSISTKRNNHDKDGVNRLTDKDSGASVRSHKSSIHPRSYSRTGSHSCVIGANCTDCKTIWPVPILLCSTSRIMASSAPWPWLFAGPGWSLPGHVHALVRIKRMGLSVGWE